MLLRIFSIKTAQICEIKFYLSTPRGPSFSEIRLKCLAQFIKGDKHKNGKIKCHTIKKSVKYVLICLEIFFFILSHNIF